MANSAYQSSYTGAQIDAAVGAVAGKADSATTLAGYGITDAYTKTESLAGFLGIGAGTNLELSSSNTVDLNTFTTIGTYYNGYSNRAQYCTNRPTTNDAAFKVFVMSSLGSSTTNVRQRYQEYNKVAAYERYSTDGGSTWSSWMRCQANLDTILPTVSTSDNGKVLEVVSGVWAAAAPVKIYSGSSAPSSGTGSDGDIYIQTS